MENTDIINLYKLLDEMKQTKEIKQLKRHIKKTLYKNLRFSFLELASVGHVIGYTELQKELKKAITLIELQK